MRSLPLQCLGRDNAGKALIEQDIRVTRAALIEARADATHARGVLIQAMQDSLKVGQAHDWAAKRRLERWLRVQAHAELKGKALRDGLAQLEARLEEMKNAADVPQPVKVGDRGILTRCVDKIVCFVQQWRGGRRCHVSSESAE